MDPWLWLSQSCSFGFISVFWHKYLFYKGFPSIEKFQSCCLGFHWLSSKLKTGCPVLLQMVFLIFWEMFHWGDVFKLSTFAGASKYCEGVQAWIDVYTPHRKYQTKPYSCPWFSAVSAASIVHRNHFFCLHQQNKSSESKVKFRLASNCCKSVLQAAKLAYATKTWSHHFSETWLCGLLANC